MSYLGGSDYNYVVPKNNQVSKENMMQDLLDDRLKTVKILLINISYEIKLRSEIENNLTKKINEDICRLRTKLFEFEQWNVGNNVQVDKYRNDLEQRIFGLEKELRDKEVYLWRDISNLQKEFRERFVEYKNIQRRFRIVQNGGK